MADAESNDQTMVGEMSTQKNTKTADLKLMAANLQRGAGDFISKTVKYLIYNKYWSFGLLVVFLAVLVAHSGMLITEGLDKTGQENIALLAFSATALVVVLLYVLSKGYSEINSSSESVGTRIVPLLVIILLLYQGTLGFSHSFQGSGKDFVFWSGVVTTSITGFLLLLKIGLFVKSEAGKAQM